MAGSIGVTYWSCVQCQNGTVMGDMAQSANDIWNDILRLLHECGDKDPIRTRDALANLRDSISAPKKGQKLHADKSVVASYRKKKLK